MTTATPVVTEYKPVSAINFYDTVDIMGLVGTVKRIEKIRGGFRITVMPDIMSNEVNNRDHTMLLSVTIELSDNWLIKTIIG